MLIILCSTCYRKRVINRLVFLNKLKIFWEKVMELHKLEPFIGQKIKNYKIMCNILDEDERNGGKSKVAQIKEWKRFFNFEREGHKFKVIEIYDVPLPKQDERRLGNNSIYISSIELILTDFLLKQKDNNYVLTKNRWFYLLGMVNRNYLEEKYEDYLVSIGISPLYINDFIFRSKNKLNTILFTSLDNMKRRNLVDYVQQIVIKPIEGKNFVANTKQEEQIIDVEQAALIEMGYKKMGDLFYKTGLLIKFFNKVEKELIKQYKWKGYYKQYDLTYLGNNNIKNVTCDLINDEKVKLNTNIIDALNNHAEKRYKKQCESFEAWERLYNVDDFWVDLVLSEDMKQSFEIPKKPFIFNDDYIYVHKELCNKLIKYNLAN